MDLNEQRSKAQRFLELHSAPEILKLPNAWDVSSAKIFQLEGYEVIGTTSAGVAATLGYADGQRMSLEESTQVTKRIAENIDLPVSADIESGYADDVGDVALRDGKHLNHDGSCHGHRPEWCGVLLCLHRGRSP